MLSFELLKEKNNTSATVLGTSMEDSLAQEISGAESKATNKFILDAIESQYFADYLEDGDTDSENEILPSTRRWTWYCRLPGCPDYYSAWACKTNFLLHLYETPVHREHSATQTGKGRRRLGRAWRQDTAYDLSEPKRLLPNADARLTAFNYSPLENSRTIRLLELFQETDGFHSPIICKIHHVSLDDETVQYRALSYCWGEPIKTQTICINGKTIFVTINLQNALRRLRTNYFCCCDLVCECSESPWYPETIDKHFTSPRLLWIDALCINQEDIEERGQQVSLMKEIYQRAGEVTVWLGEEGDDTVPALRLLCGLGEIAPLQEAKTLIAHVVQNEIFRNYWSALGDFLGRPWWNRVWILQEILLAKRARIICGRWLVNWLDIFSAVLTFMDCQDYMDEIAEANISDQPKELQSFRWKAGVLTHFRLPDPADPAVFKDFLNISKNRDSSDPRDKIYGFLGIMEHLSGRCFLKVDYTISVCELYMQVCLVLWQETKSLDFLSMVERNRIQNPNRGIIPALPSWTPDWTVRTNQYPILRDGSHPPLWSSTNPKPRALSEKFSFTGNSTAECTFHLDSMELEVRGFIVDTIKDIKGRWIDLTPNFSLEGVTRYGHRICWLPSSPEEVSRSSCFWATRLNHVYALGNALESPIADDGENTTPRVDQLVFTSEAHGYLGATDAAIRIGDVICALFGGNVPYVLRSREASWVLVGQW